MHHAHATPTSSCLLLYMRCMTGVSGEKDRTVIALVWRFLASRLALICCATDVICFLQKEKVSAAIYSNTGCLVTNGQTI